MKYKIGRGEIWKKICIFFDTNTLEKRNGDSLISLSKIDIPVEPFYNVINFIDNYHLWENVKLLIPDIVVMEMKHHLIKAYEKNSISFSKFVSDYKKMFGELIDIDNDRRIKKQQDEYVTYVDELFNEFFDNNKNHITLVKCKKDEDTMNTLIDKAIKTKAPFSESGGKGKKYTDAGFKDAVIYETIDSYIQDNNAVGIFFTQDHDYGDTSEDFKLIKVIPESKSKAFDDFKKIMKKHFNILEQDDFETKLKDSYFKSRILEEAELPYDDYNLIGIIQGTYKQDEQDIIADIIIRIDEDKLRIHIEYNYVANEIYADNLGQYEDEDN